MDRTQEQTTIYRHGETVAVHFTDSQTLYLTPAMAGRMATELRRFVKYSTGDKWPTVRLIDRAGLAVNESNGKVKPKYV